jgi:hypothetical protein
LTLLFTIGIVAVSLALQVIVPAILGVLSLFFARPALRNAASVVRRAGDVAIDGMRTSRRWFLARDPQETARRSQATRVRIDGSAPVRVANEDAARDADEESGKDAEEHTDDGDAARRRAR